MFSVQTCQNIDFTNLVNLFARFQLNVKRLPENTDIPGSFWGESEAGLISSTLYVRPDTPVHSALHEGCHYICMDEQRRQQLHTDAGGEAVEENAVCYLQILLADHIPYVGRERIWRDMDEWGYSFRLGSARAWFEQDAADACEWLQQHGIINAGGEVMWQLRR